MSIADWLAERKRIDMEALVAVAIAKSTDRPSFDLAGVALDKSRLANRDAHESLPLAVNALLAVMDLHKPCPACRDVCAVDHEDWPCRTVQSVGDGLEVEP